MEEAKSVDVVEDTAVTVEDTALTTSDNDTALRDAVEKEVRPCMDLVDQLRAIGIEQDLPIPQIAVMGDQSSGKSSVLEALSGVPFPRGKGLVTRCATQLRLRRGAEWSAGWSILWHEEASSKELPPLAKRQIASPQDVGLEIERLTKFITAGDGAFSRDIICIDVKSPDVPELTLIDLPGIVRTTVAGQSGSVIEEVNALVDHFLNQERTIVLAVIPCNADIATNDILERARKVDPEGNRTLGVLTKPDLIDRGAEDEVLSVLENTRKPMRLGYVMVKMRSQYDLDNGVDLAMARKKEHEFFARHEIFGRAEPQLVGIKNLTKRCTQVLVSQIQHHLPKMATEVETQLTETETQLGALGLPPPSDLQAQVTRLVQISQGYGNLLSKAIQADYSDQLFSVGGEGRRIYTRCREEFLKLQELVRRAKPTFDSPELRTEVLSKIAGSRGRELPGFLNPKVFNVIMTGMISPCREHAKAAHAACKKLVLQGSFELLGEFTSQFPVLAKQARSIVHSVIESLADAALKHVEQLFDQELEPFTLNHYYMDTFNKLRRAQLNKNLEGFVQALPTSRVVEVSDLVVAGVTSFTHLIAVQNSGTTMKKSPCLVIGQATPTPTIDVPLSERISLSKADMVELLGRWTEKSRGASNEEQEADELLAHLESYWKVTSKRLVDEFPKIVEVEVLRVFGDKLQTALFILATDAAQLPVLFAEAQSTKMDREQLNSKLLRLRKAQSIILKQTPLTMTALTNI